MPLPCFLKFIKLAIFSFVLGSCLIFARDIPPECLFVPKKFVILYYRAVKTPRRHITKVFFAVLNRKSDSFPRNKGERTALISCIVMCGYARYVHIPHTIQVWGIASFICFGFCQSLYLVNEKMAPHFLFISITS